MERRSTKTTHPTPFFLADKVPIYLVAVAQFRPILVALQGTSSTHRTCPVRATRGHPSDSSDCEANISRGTWPTFFLVVVLVYLPTLKENVTEGSVSTEMVNFFAYRPSQARTCFQTYRLNRPGSSLSSPPAKVFTQASFLLLVTFVLKSGQMRSQVLPSGIYCPG